jgi:dienelactone hydrolase
LLVVDASDDARHDLRMSKTRTLRRAAFTTLTFAAVFATACARNQGGGIGVAIAPPIAPPPLWIDLEPGAYAVRLDTLMRRAPEKTGWAAAGRPVQVTIWSPATARGTPLTYRDYIALTANQASLAPATAEASAAAVQRLTSFVTANGSSAAAVEQWLDMPVAASWDAPLATHRFPLVVIAQGNFHSAYNQAVLGEYLASHGYVVATSPSPLVLEQAADSTSVITRARRQAADIEYVIDAMRTRTDVDTTRIGVVAHSFGARAAFVAAMDGAPFRSFVSLDGGIANKLGADWLDGTALASAELRMPVLHVYQDKDEAVQPDFTRLRSWHAADRTLVHVDDMYHPYFTALGFVAAVDTALHVAPKVPDLGRKVSGVVELTATFLDATLRNRRAVAPAFPFAQPPLFTIERIPAAN